MNTTSRRIVLGVVLGFLGLAALPLRAAELDGVRLDDLLSVAGQKLALNGFAMRKKAMFSVYIGALYLSHASHDAKAILADAGPRALVMRFVRDVDKEKLVDAFSEGFTSNAPTALAHQKPAADAFLGKLRNVKDGDRLTFIYDPAAGSLVKLNDATLSQVPGKEFADLCLAVFLGPDPPTDALKDGLLGK